MLNRSYGIWVFRSRDPLEDKRVYREDGRGYQVQSRFYRSVGARYKDHSVPRFLNTWGGIVGHSPRSNPRTPAELLSGFFTKGPPLRHRAKFQTGSVAAVVGCKGYAVVAAKHLRRFGLPGVAQFIGNIRVRVEREA